MLSYTNSLSYFDIYIKIKAADIKKILDQFESESHLSIIPKIIIDLGAFYSSLKYKESTLTNNQTLKLCQILASRELSEDFELEENLATLQNSIAPGKIFDCFNLLLMNGLYEIHYWRSILNKYHKMHAKVDCAEKIYISTQFLILEVYIQAESIEEAKEFVKIHKINPDQPETKKSFERIFRELCTNIEYQDAEIVQNDLKNAIEVFSSINFNFNYIFTNDQTPLIHLVTSFADSLLVLDALIAAGADIHKEDKHDLNVIHYAAIHNRVEIVKSLLELGASLTDPDLTLMCSIDRNYKDKRNTSIRRQSYFLCEEYLDCITATNKNLLIIELLIKLEKSSDILQRALKYAISIQNWSVVETMLKMKAPVYDCLMEDILKTNCVLFVKKFINKILPLNKLQIVIPAMIPYPVNSEIFKLCLDCGMLPDKYSFYDVQVLQTPKAVKYFIQQKKTFDVTLALNKNEFSTILCTENTPGYNCEYYLPHLVAARAANESLAILIAAGMDFEKKDSKGLTPLFYAIYYGKDNNFKLLMIAGANINAADNKKRSLLHFCVQNNYSNHAAILLYMGANKQATDQNNKKPSHYVKVISVWMEIFQTTKRNNIPIYTGRNMPTLFQLSAQTIACKKPEIINNLAYRNMMFPEECVNVIEEEAMKIVEPKKRW